ncbi:hypothetical protein DPMN_091997 [Dreissena polymorpha]|uniref:Uncharacterized protein n=1 Tax=Dreissena polymorpha TaxID=45954 RepID=A0A9D4L1I8_DREPO|nr:hypothetical protein DPMN_091997 [Dreissena polymorpha]
MTILDRLCSGDVREILHGDMRKLQECRLVQSHHWTVSERMRRGIHGKHVQRK